MAKRHKSLKWAANQLVNRSLQGVSHRHSRGWAKPTRIIFCVTLRCNIKCKQCAIWRMPKPDELTTNEWKNVITDLREWIGPYRVQLAGGETFVRNDIVDIVRHATDKNVLTGIVSNGTLITADLAREVVGSGLGYIHISVDGIKPGTHDEIRGIPGLHVKTMAGLNHLLDADKDRKMAISVATVVMKRNMHELVDMVKMVEKEPRLGGIIFNPLGPTIDSDPDWYKKTDLWFDNLDEINAVIDELKAMKKKGAKILNPPEQFDEMKKYFKKPVDIMKGKCFVGITNMSITCDGFIHTCFKMPPLGNVRQIMPSKAWDSKTAREIRDKIKRCDIHCSPGNFVYRRSLISEVLRYLNFG
jgi:MoaA/NifB/PqqE/SkfB family radical SAM enzyme